MLECLDILRTSLYGTGEDFLKQGIRSIFKNDAMVCGSLIR